MAPLRCGMWRSINPDWICALLSRLVASMRRMRIFLLVSLFLFLSSPEHRLDVPPHACTSSCCWSRYRSWHSFLRGFAALGLSETLIVITKRISTAFIASCAMLGQKTINIFVGIWILDQDRATALSTYLRISFIVLFCDFASGCLRGGVKTDSVTSYA